MPQMDIRGIDRLGNADKIGRDQNAIRGLMVTQNMPEYAATQQRGEGWSILTATPFAPVAAVPTVTAALEVYNNDPARVMMISDLHGFQLLSTAATQTYGLWAMVTTVKAAPSLTALSVFSKAGKNLLTPTAAGLIITGVGTTVVANGWEPYGPVQTWGTAAALPGNSLHFPTNGRLVVPPRCSICVTAVGTIATASSFHVGISFDWATGVVEA